MMQPVKTKKKKRKKKKKVGLGRHHMTVNLQASGTAHSGSDHDASYKLKTKLGKCG